MKRRCRSHDTVPFTQGRLEDDLDYSSEEDEEEEEEGEEWDEVEPGTSSQHQQPATAASLSKRQQLPTAASSNKQQQPATAASLRKLEQPATAAELLRLQVVKENSVVSGSCSSRFLAVAADSKCLQLLQLIQHVYSCCS